MKDLKAKPLQQNHIATFRIYPALAFQLKNLWELFLPIASGKRLRNQKLK